MKTLRLGSRPSSSGFSLLEILIVLILLALAAAIIAPSFTGGMKGLYLETAGRDMVTLLKQARSKAIGSQTVCRVVLSKEHDGGRYMMTDAYGAEIKSYPLPKGVTFHVEDEASLPLTVSFYPNGRSSGGSFTLVNEQGKQMPISIDPITGFGRVVSTEAQNESR